MIWADIIRGIMFGPRKMSDGIRMITVAYIAFLREHLETLLKKQRIIFRRTIIFKQDNALSHAAHKTMEHL